MTKIPSRWSPRVTRLRQKRAEKEAADTTARAEEEKRRAEAKTQRKRQEPLAFWMKRKLTDEAETEIENWRMLVQMPPGVWQRTWDAFGHGTAYYVASPFEGGAHLTVELPRPQELWWEIKITAWDMELAHKIGEDYPEMMRECLGEAIERLEGVHDHLMSENRRATLTATLREGEKLVQAWIERYAFKEQG